MMMLNPTAGKVSKCNKASINVEQCQQHYQLQPHPGVPERQQRIEMFMLPRVKCTDKGVRVDMRGGG